MAKSIKSQLSALGKLKKLNRLKVNHEYGRILDRLEDVLDATASRMDMYTGNELFLRSENRTLLEAGELDYSDGKIKFDAAVAKYSDLKKLEGLYNYYWKTIFQICEVDVIIKGSTWSKQEVQKFNDEHPIPVVTKELIVAELHRLIQKDKFGEEGDDYNGIPDPVQKEKMEKQVNLFLNELKDTALKNGTIKQKDMDKITKKHYKVIGEEIQDLETDDRDRFYLFNYNLSTFLNLKMVEY